MKRPTDYKIAKQKKNNLKYAKFIHARVNIKNYNHYKSYKIIFTFKFKCNFIK